jgi:hypothetical protein
MKLFGGGKPSSQPSKPEAKDEEAGYFDSPTENVSLSTPPPKVSVAPPKDEPPPSPEFGINAAIQLMRSLPVDQNPELVVTVIKTTLESLRVKVPEIIADAGRKQTDLRNRVDMLKKEISDYEKEIQQRKDEIAKLEADYEETTNVKGRLELAEKMKGRPPAAPAAKTGT